MSDDDTAEDFDDDTAEDFAFLRELREPMTRGEATTRARAGLSSLASMVKANVNALRPSERALVLERQRIADIDLAPAYLVGQSAWPPRPPPTAPPQRDPGWLIVFAPSLEGGAPLYWAARVRYPFIGLELATAAQLVRLHGSARCWVWLETPCGIVWTYNLHDPAAWRELVDELKARPGSGEWAG
jgi:hypothetical protein